MSVRVNDRVGVLRGSRRGLTGAVLAIEGGSAVIRPDATDGADAPVNVPVADLGLRIRMPNAATGTIINERGDSCRVRWDETGRCSWVTGGAMRPEPS